MNEFRGNASRYGLTRAAILAYMKEEANEFGMLEVSHEDIARAYNISTATVARAIRSLIGLGLLDVVAGKSGQKPTLYQL